MKSRFVVVLISLMFLAIALLMIAVAVKLYADWSRDSLSNNYLLPEYPGVKRLGTTRSDFPHAFNSAWETENTILFLKLENKPGGDFYRYSLDSDTLEQVFQNFLGFMFQLSPDKKYIAFSGWPKESSVHRQIWLASLNSQPAVIGSKSLSKYDLGFLGWLYDGKSLMFGYSANKRISIINKDTEDIVDFSLREGELNVTGKFTALDSQHVMVNNAAGSGIMVLNISTRTVEVYSYGNSAVGTITRIPSKNWLVGTIHHPEINNGGGQLFFVPNDNQCVKEPFKDLIGIAKVDAIESGDTIFLLLEDTYGYLYVMNLNEALHTKNLGQFFTCP